MSATRHEIRSELGHLRTVVRKLDNMKPGERGRALRYILSRYEKSIREDGLKGEP